MRPAASVLCLTLGALAAGCNGDVNPQSASLAGQAQTPATLIPGSNPPDPLLSLEPAAAPAKVAGGIYAGEFYFPELFGYGGTNRQNMPPVCTVSGVSYVNGIGADRKGNLIDPDGGSRTVKIFKGPDLCGPQLLTLSDPYGQPSDAASFDARGGRIVVANIFDGPASKDYPGSVTICTVAVGCAQNLANPNLNLVAAVAYAKNGDCWASGANASDTAVLIYFKSCDGGGVTATHFKNRSYGGLDIDSSGNLVSISFSDSKLYVYEGCNPRCALAGGPFILKASEIFGHLNADSTLFAAANYETSKIDLYAYRPSRVRYKYSFDNGLNGTYQVEGVAFTPRSKE